MTKYSNKRVTFVIIFAVLSVFTIIMIYSFTSQSGYQSNVESIKIAKSIERIISRYYDVNPEDVFWKKTFNELLRKTAHFMEYAALGIFSCALFNILFKACSKAVLISLAFCPVLAMLDEYRQQFVIGRNPCWYDIQVDICGAILGIILATLVFTVVWKIMRLQYRVNLLENKMR